jgi:hypothetical protein
VLLYSTPIKLLGRIINTCEHHFQFFLPFSSEAVGTFLLAFSFSNVQDALAVRYLLSYDFFIETVIEPYQ